MYFPPDPPVTCGLGLALETLVVPSACSNASLEQSFPKLLGLAIVSVDSTSYRPPLVLDVLSDLPISVGSAGLVAFLVFTVLRLPRAVTTTSIPLSTFGVSLCAIVLFSHRPSSPRRDTFSRYTPPFPPATWDGPLVLDVLDDESASSKASF